ncbi:MAG TPA: hypothetical protein VJV78_09660 [Polyangiales bacterium]|nr:hypothetical protein [Polyangiales bacterium]
MQALESSRALLRLAVIVLCVGAGAGVWEVLASQAPGSPLFIGMLPGPIEMLREAATLIGVLLLAASCLVRDRPLPRALLIALHVAVVVTLLAALYGAATGMHGVQVIDLRPDAIPLFAAKYAGRLGLATCLFLIARRALTR